MSSADRIDLLTALQEQENWIDVVQARVLAEIDAADTSSLGLSQEAVSLALKVPLRTAQRMLKTGRSLVGELPKTLALLAGGEISERHAQLITETAWRLDPEWSTSSSSGSPSVPRIRRSANCANRRAGPNWPWIGHRPAAPRAGVGRSHGGLPPGRRWHGRAAGAGGGCRGAK